MERSVPHRLQDVGRAIHAIERYTALRPWNADIYGAHLVALYEKQDELLAQLNQACDASVYVEYDDEPSDMLSDVREPA